MIILNNNSNDFENKRAPVFVFIIMGLASAFIVGLVVVYYMVATDSFPQFVKKYFEPEEVKVKDIQNLAPQKNVKPIAPVVVDKFSTKVIRYSFPLNLMAEKKAGQCFSSSVAQPYRQDAFRCQAEDSIYDPCFSNLSGNTVVCQMNPLQNNIFLINLQNKLPEFTLPAQIKENWAWFAELEDGTICAPYTGTKPIINGQEAVYGCKPKIKGGTDVLVGDLQKSGTIWTAKRFIKEENFSSIVRIKTMWQ